MLSASVWYEDVAIPIENDDWRALIPREAVGRVACTIAALPAVIPVVFRVDGDKLMLVAPQGWRVRDALDGTVVALEISIETPVDRRCWSILLVGPASIVGPGDVDAAGAFRGLDPHGYLVRLRPEIASARPVPTTAPPGGAPAPAIPDGGSVRLR